jgi:hypothetical protein
MPPVRPIIFTPGLRFRSATGGRESQQFSFEKKSQKTFGI